MKESDARRLLSILIQEFNRLVQSCPIVIIKLRYCSDQIRAASQIRAEALI